MQELISYFYKGISTHPIFIEFKRVKEANPKISKEQKEFKKFLDDNNYKNFFAFGFLDAMEKIKEVIDDKNWKW